ncbi:hypothetical protein EU96_1555 [Prochlorococcus marinus str. MIT 9302]|uniref:Glycosyl transferase family 1 domain-containing protein n=1 Tax=Prochlorococcus marinus str. MIT 9302 TaxID=74545 RepID=A0A0A2A4U6_PROMR|nr:glycosyltransferase [Prochlorococcus marinus]KGF96917.1 hypothetical protein EU96_1555 [Prochlorococcus marinus str. MIT 9302]
MRVINHLADFSSLGGVQSYIYGLCNKFPENYCIYNSGSEVLDIYRNKSIEYKKLFSFKFFFNRTREIFIVHNLILSKKWILIYFLLRIKGCEVIYHEHGSAWSNPQKNKDRYNKRIIKYKKIIVNSDATKYLLNNFYKVDTNLKVLRSPIFIYEEILNNKKNSVDRKVDKTKKDKLIIGYIGRLAFHKNPSFLIALALQLKEKYEEKVELHFVGSGPERNNLQNLCKEKNIDSIFWGRVKDRREGLSKWKYCIVPSIREPLGLIPGEMAIQNILTFSSKVDGLRELYPIDCNYLLIDMKKNKKSDNSNIQFLPKYNDFGYNYYPNVSQCVEKIINLNKNHDKYIELLIKHRNFIKKNFDISKHSEELREFVFKS